MSYLDEQVSAFVDACILIAEMDLSIVANHKNPDLQSKVQYFSPSALEALAQLEILIEQRAAAQSMETAIRQP